MSTGTAAFLFAPGAGAGAGSDWMESWAARLAALGVVRPFDYPYRRAGRRAPDRAPVLIEAHREALRSLRQEHDGPVYLAGKSMGGRIGCHLALEERVTGLVCLGYPLQAPGGRRGLRDQVLLDSRTPILFVQGTRDPLCPLDLLAGVRRRMQAPSRLHVVDGGDHSLLVGRGNQEEADREVLQAIASFVEMTGHGSGCERGEESQPKGRTTG